MDLEYVLLMIIDCLSRFFSLFERMLKGQGKEIWFEIELKGVAFNVELASRYFDIRHSDIYQYECFVLF